MLIKLKTNLYRKAKMLLRGIRMLLKLLKRCKLNKSKIKIILQVILSNHLKTKFPKGALLVSSRKNMLYIKIRMISLLRLPRII